MGEFFAREGDILLYSHAPNLSTRLIQFGEELEDGMQPVECYHVAIALDGYRKIEADGKNVAINPIDYERCAVFRPPIDKGHIRQGLGETLKLVDQPYDWVLILDDALRYFTHNYIHLPVQYVKSQERRKKICSSLVAFYFGKAQWGHLGRNASPEDVWLQVKDWPVVG